MNQPAKDSPSRRRFFVMAGVLGLVVGMLGLYPHLRWSREMHQIAWFYNSYDEGFYGWQALGGSTPDRWLSSLVMHLFFHLSGASTQGMMIAADFCLPALVTMAACYLVRPLCVRATGMAAAALLVLVSAEVLALRSSFIPFAQVHPWLQSRLQALAGGPAGWVQMDNLTSTFWLFRTPEPQVSWIPMFLVLGLGLRRVLRWADDPDRIAVWFGICAFFGLGYLFCVLPVGGAMLLFAVLAWSKFRRTAHVVGAGGLASIIICLGVSMLAARKVQGDSLLFPSHSPVITLGVVVGLVAAGIVAVRCIRCRNLQPIHLLAMAFGFAPLCVANQQLLTGRMIYLSNFDNFGFPQLAAVALLVAVSANPRIWPAAAPAHASGAMRRGWASALAGPVVALLLAGVLGRSQVLSYQTYLADNRVARSYAQALHAIGETRERVLCEDFFSTNILPLLLGYRPDFLVARDMVFTRPIGRLKGGGEFPTNSDASRTALFEYLAVSGVKPEELATRLAVLTDPSSANWQDRFILGGFLYNHADFWAPFTHHRDTKFAWIGARQPAVVQAYRDYLATPLTGALPLLVIVRQEKPVPIVPNRTVVEVAGPVGLATAPLKVYRVTPAVPSGR